MSLINDILGAIGAQGNNPQAQQHQDLMASLSSMLHNPAMGGVGGLLQKLQSGGLASAVQSWIGTGQNQAITPDQLRGAMGDDQLQQLAKNAGMSTQQASSGLASILPALVDKLSPNGQLHDESTMSKMLDALRGGGLPS
jgi:uncharacterized protein YidB (DUF937 family)